MAGSPGLILADAALRHNAELGFNLTIIIPLRAIPRQSRFADRVARSLPFARFNPRGQ